MKKNLSILSLLFLPACLANFEDVPYAAKPLSSEAGIPSPLEALETKQEAGSANGNDSAPPNVDGSSNDGEGHEASLDATPDTSDANATPDASADVIRDVISEDTGTCFDGVKNGSESDVDCGGTCPRCATGKSCNGPNDCVTNACLGGLNLCQ